jgi:hypothetical protein
MFGNENKLTRKFAFALVAMHGAWPEAHGLMLSSIVWMPFIAHCSAVVFAVEQ